MRFNFLDFVATKFIQNLTFVQPYMASYRLEIRIYILYIMF